MNQLSRAIGVFAALLLVGACTDNDTVSPGSDARVMTVSSTDKACKVSSTSAPAGHLTFAVRNDGSQVTEFYLLASDGLRIVGEVENIGPGITRKLVVEADPGSYITACKPGMRGDGIRARFKVTDSDEQTGASGDATGLLSTATSQYAAYVRDQSNQLLDATKTFADLYTKRSDDQARALYAATRMHWERIEPVAESFGDLDPKLDLREADLEEGQEWTGWHRIEKDLWPPTGSAYAPLDDAGRQAVADQLVADTSTLDSRVQKMTFQPAQLGNGAKELLDEVVTGKITGEEEAWSHTDLWDFQANVEGARIAFEVLKPALDRKQPKLATRLTDAFATLQAELDTHRRGDGFVLYPELDEAQVRALSDKVNALGEPLAELTAAVVL